MNGDTVYFFRQVLHGGSLLSSMFSDEPQLVLAGYMLCLAFSCGLYTVHNISKWASRSLTHGTFSHVKRTSGVMLFFPQFRVVFIFHATFGWNKPAAFKYKFLLEMTAWEGKTSRHGRKGGWIWPRGTKKRRLWWKGKGEEEWSCDHSASEMSPTGLESQGTVTQ